MARKRKGMDVNLHNFCPHCRSNKFIKNGHPHNDKLQYFCKSCKRYFSEDSLKGYPPTNIPFPVIAYLLYFHLKVPEFSNMRKYRPFVNYWLKYLQFYDRDFSRQSIHHWIKNFNPLLDKVTTFNDARKFCQNRIKELSKVRPPKKAITYHSALQFLTHKLGKNRIILLIRRDEIFFGEFVDIVSKHGVFGWEFSESEFGGGSVGYRSVAKE